jgi:hypothetical protein
VARGKHAGSREVLRVGVQGRAHRLDEPGVQAMLKMKKIVIADLEAAYNC